jgi:hypothetical protein
MNSFYAITKDASIRECSLVFGLQNGNTEASYYDFASTHDESSHSSKEFDIHHSHLSRLKQKWKEQKMVDIFPENL